MRTVQVNTLWRAAFLDPASGPENKGGRARSAIVVVGQDAIDRIFILRVWAQRSPTTSVVNEVFATHKMYRPAVFGFDATAHGGILFGEILRKEARERGVTVPFREVKFRTEKTFSIETTLQPVGAAGRLFRPEEAQCRVLKEEMTGFPDTSVPRDALDALAHAIRLLPSMLPEHLRIMGREQLRRYLERSGMAPDEVELRMTQHAENAKSRGTWQPTQV